MNNAISNSSMPLLKHNAEKSEFDILQVNYEEMNKLIEMNGGGQVFGNFDRWDDTFCIRRKYQRNPD